MNTIDIIIIAILIFGAIQGIREGLILQILSIVGILLAIFLGTRFGESVADIFSIGGGQKAIWGFIIVFFVTIVAVAIVARIIRKMISFAGLKMVDVVAGGALSVCKYLLVMSFAFGAFESVNKSYKLFDHKPIEESVLYQPITNLSNVVAPAWEWAEDQLDIK